MRVLTMQPLPRSGGAVKSRNCYDKQPYQMGYRWKALLIGYIISYGTSFVSQISKSEDVIKDDMSRCELWLSKKCLPFA